MITDYLGLKVDGIRILPASSEIYYFTEDRRQTVKGALTFRERLTGRKLFRTQVVLSIKRTTTRLPSLLITSRQTVLKKDRLTSLYTLIPLLSDILVTSSVESRLSTQGLYRTYFRECTWSRVTRRTYPTFDSRPVSTFLSYPVTVARTTPTVRVG